MQGKGNTTPNKSANDTKLAIPEIVIAVVIVVVGFYFAQKYDVFEQLVALTRHYEEYEIDEIFTLLIISSIVLLAILIKTNKRLSREIVQRRLAEENYKELALHDQLTKLPNRSLCMDRLEQLIRQSGRTHKKLAVLFVDLDDFKRINDTYGHDYGDLLLTGVSERLTSLLRKGDTLSRIGGDEFIVLLESINSSADVAITAEKIIEGLQHPFELNDVKVTIGASIGIAIHPQDGCKANLLIKHADAAMYKAKRNCKNTFRFFSEEDSEAQNGALAQLQLHKALENNEFSVLYQPIINLVDKRIVGAEALLRWNNHQLGKVSPRLFIPMAEDMGLIEEIGEWALLEICNNAKQLFAEGKTDLIISCNISVSQLFNCQFDAIVKKCLDSTGLSPQTLEFEFSGAAVMGNLDKISKSLSQLRELGVSIALDNVGMHCASIKGIDRSLVNRIKIDKELLKNMPHDKQKEQSFVSMLKLAQELQIPITIQGIETEAQQTFIEATTAESAQGFLIGRPMNIAELIVLMQRF